MKNKKVVTAITVAALCATAPATAAFAAQTGNVPGTGQQMAAEQMTEGEQQAPPTEGEQQAPPANGEQQAPPANGEQQAPPTEGEQQAPPTEGEQQAPPTEGEQQAPPTEGEQQAPPTEGEQQAPPTNGEQQASPAEGEQQAPPTADQNGPKTELSKQIRALIDKLTKYLEEMELIGDSNKPMIDIKQQAGEQ